MSQLKVFLQKSVQTLRAVSLLTQHIRNKTTSEHVLKLRCGETVQCKSLTQLALENKSHMNFHPIPEGCWQEEYRTRNLKWAKMLMLSFTFFGITTYVAYWMDCFYLHSRPSRRKISPNVEKTGKVRV